MSKKYKIEYDRAGCIGVGACVAADFENWQLAEDNKADMKDGKQDKETKFFVRIIDASELQRWMDAAKSCPVIVIHIIDLETGEVLI